MILGKKIFFIVLFSTMFWALLFSLAFSTINKKGVGVCLNKITYGGKGYCDYLPNSEVTSIYQKMFPYYNISTETRSFFPDEGSQVWDWIDEDIEFMYVMSYFSDNNTLDFTTLKCKNLKFVYLYSMYTLDIKVDDKTYEKVENITFKGTTLNVQGSDLKIRQLTFDGKLSSGSKILKPDKLETHVEYLYQLETSMPFNDLQLNLNPTNAYYTNEKTNEIIVKENGWEIQMEAIKSGVANNTYIINDSVATGELTIIPTNLNIYLTLEKVMKVIKSFIIMHWEKLSTSSKLLDITTSHIVFQGPWDQLVGNDQNNKIKFVTNDPNDLIIENSPKSITIEKIQYTDEYGKIVDNEDGGDSGDGGSGDKSDNSDNDKQSSNIEDISQNQQKTDSKTNSNDSSTNEKEPTQGLSNGAIAGIVIGCLAFVAIIVAVVVFVVLKKKKKSKVETSS
ncbi:hypothetical protein TRFO_19659 [Tritrichomonas foetus]|uniref:Uncharacterized protein n=1 Tax=Tritrichomonas foetus TaxID=1144522 RepID=A0A1J4KHK2_9EUKA|nr:hypothetical protein TRFO_19659 [Tritrichomonas foetus]|eukprot:OHT10871.1 hypothetical protein TRFO_19659 [Tritrichomonas foetus]